MQLRCDGSKFRVTMKQNLTYSAELSDDAVGNVTRINNALESLAERLDAQKARLTTLESELETPKKKPTGHSQKKKNCGKNLPA